MINRYAIAKTKTSLSKRFKVNFPSVFKPNYNAAHYQQLPIITNESPNVVTFSQWGLIPYSAKDTQIGEKLLNARKKTLGAKQPFCDLINTNRCLILADSYFIWTENNNVKTPYRIIKGDEETFAIAGLWSEWKLEDEDGEHKLFHSFSMITTEAPDPLHKIGDRMPLILPNEAEGEWLRNGQNKEDYLNILNLEDKDTFSFYKISNLINKEENNSKKSNSRTCQPKCWNDDESF